MTDFFRPRALRAGDVLSEFNCGVESLDSWIRGRARENEKRGASRTFVSVTPEDQVAGYYCLSASAIALAETPAALGRRMPDPVPVLLLGRLAVDAQFAGRGLGSSLLADAVSRALTAADSIGAVAMIVHASTEDVVGFYERFGFERFPASQQSLFLLFSDARASLE